ncbi:FUSC family protein [Actinomadura verrucosospora]|uniref:Integral membrane protein n=1 Tax=Actinomadura verrucosospora TaxID=46165 RepID=A0A7D4APR0_ACTVE|nr:FUSC family protein [Actinomadura verrucosospora]QKG21989.1 integral membrane protein [Actinomadura verrucosospora]
MRGYLLPWAGRRYWRERLKLTAKAVLAGVIAWAAAKYLIGHAEPYFAPLAALLGVYPSVVRSVRESVTYAAGFVIGAALAIPVGIWIGPNVLGIAVVLFLAMMASGWRRLGGQASQVPFTALFALLLGGHDAVGYTLPRLGDVALGLVVGLAVNAVVFPPLYLRRAEYAVEQLRDVLAEAMDALAAAVADPGEHRASWDEADERLRTVQDQARHAYEQGRDSMRANPRAKLRGYPLRWRDEPERWPATRLMNTLEQATTYVRSIAGTHQEAMDVEEPELRFSAEFRDDHARLVELLAGLVRRLPEAPGEEELADAERLQQRLERPHHGPGTDAPGLWDPQKEVLRLSRLMLDDLRPRPPR